MASLEPARPASLPPVRWGLAWRVVGPGRCATRGPHTGLMRHTDPMRRPKGGICYNVIVDFDMIESIQISVPDVFLCSWFVVTLQSRLEHSTASASRFVSHQPAASLTVTQSVSQSLTRAIWDTPGLNENRPSVGIITGERLIEAPLKEGSLRT